MLLQGVRGVAVRRLPEGRLLLGRHRLRGGAAVGGTGSPAGCGGRQHTAPWRRPAARFHARPAANEGALERPRGGRRGGARDRRAAARPLANFSFLFFNQFPGASHPLSAPEMEMVRRNEHKAFFFKSSLEMVCRLAGAGKEIFAEVDTLPGYYCKQLLVNKSGPANGVSTTPENPENRF
uniref:Uncharacterized protein n=1 Tax=Setaria viridis TaxID=4556 RepID=A0A4U6SUW6_SETVI|nr:hypothetical protein SEVIR_9G173500v2 [Setaria viridis]